MPLVTSQGYQLQPDILGAIRQGQEIAHNQQVLGTNRLAQQQEEQQLGTQNQTNQNIRDVLGSQQGRSPEMQDAQLADILINNPKTYSEVLSKVGLRKEEDAVLWGRIGETLSETPIEQRANKINEISEWMKMNGQPEEYQSKLINLSSQPESSQNTAFQMMKAVSGAYQEKLRPMSEYQKASTDLRAAEAGQKKLSAELKLESDRLKIEGLKTKANEKKVEKLDSAKVVVDSGNATLELIDAIESHPGFGSAVGAKGASSLFGLLDDPIAGSEAAGAVALIETLEAQNFLTAISEFKAAGGAGSLSDAEGKKLGAAISNLKRAQSEGDFNASLKTIRELVQKQISNISQKSIIKDQAQMQTTQAIDNATGETVTFALINGQWVKQ